MTTTIAKQMISDEEKQQIALDLHNFVEKRAGGSRNKASKMLHKVSISYISQMLNNKWDAISDDAWRNLQKQVSTSYKGKWVVVKDIANYQELAHLFDDSRQYAMTFGIIGNAGWGKTCTALEDNDNPNTFLIRCNDAHDRRNFLQDLLTQMGLEDSEYSINKMMAKVITHVRKLDHPVIKIDEADKLSDNVLYFFISLYNSLEGECGLVMTGAPYLKTRIETGAKKNKKGYKEILSRLGGRFIVLDKPKDSDVRKIIQANGISDPLVIAKIINDADGDLRRVDRLVHAEKRRVG